MSKIAKPSRKGPALTRIGKLVRYPKPGLITWLVENTDDTLPREEALAFYQEMMRDQPEVMDTKQAAAALGVSHQMLAALRSGQ